MRTRLALTFALVLGLMMTGTGATLAVTGIAGDGDATVAQYDRSGGGGGQVLGETEERTGTGVGTDAPEGTDGEVAPLGTDADGGSGGESQTQQVAAADSDGLPFTGLVVFPLLIGGVALAGVGGVLRVKARDVTSSPS